MNLLKESIKNNWLLFKLAEKGYYCFETLKSVVLKELVVRSASKNVRIKKTSKGRNNVVLIGKNSYIDRVFIRIIGSDNKIIIGDNCRISHGCSFWIEGNGSVIRIGDDTSMNYNVHICAQEDNMTIAVGKECMFANNIIIRTSDSHPIFNMESHVRINPPASVNIGDRVWVAAKATIMKGVTISSDCVVGFAAVVTRDVPPNSLVAGVPAKVVKSNIYWGRTL